MVREARVVEKGKGDDESEAMRAETRSNITL